MRFCNLKVQNLVLKMWKVNRPTAVYSSEYVIFGHSAPGPTFYIFASMTELKFKVLPWSSNKELAIFHFLVQLRLPLIMRVFSSLVGIGNCKDSLFTIARPRILAANALHICLIFTNYRLRTMTFPSRKTKINWNYGRHIKESFQNTDKTKSLIISFQTASSFLKTKIYKHFFASQLLIVGIFRAKSPKAQQQPRFTQNLTRSYFVCLV